MTKCRVRVTGRVKVQRSGVRSQRTGPYPGTSIAQGKGLGQGQGQDQELKVRAVPRNGNRVQGQGLGQGQGQDKELKVRAIPRNRVQCQGQGLGQGQGQNQESMVRAIPRNRVQGQGQGKWQGQGQYQELKGGSTQGHTQVYTVEHPATRRYLEGGGTRDVCLLLSKSYLDQRSGKLARSG